MKRDNKLGIPVFIADAGSIPSFLKAVESLPGIQVRVEGGNLVQKVKGSLPALWLLATVSS